MARRKALIVGIDTYPEAGLAYCELDAREVAAVLSMPEYGYETELLLNGAAQRRETLIALQRLFDNGEDDVLVYFAGHGVHTPYGTYLMTVDGDRVDPGIGLDYLGRIASGADPGGGSVTLLLDCCHAGAAGFRSVADSAIRAMAAEDIKKLGTQLGAGRALIAACRSDQGAEESRELRHGVFTHYLIEALCGEASDGEGCVTLAAVFDYISQRLERNGRQVPVLKGDLVGRYLLGRNLTPRARMDLNGDDLGHLERQSKEMMEEYLRTVQMPMDRWLVQGYREACRRLEPILHWFEAPPRRSPQLSSRHDFRTAFQTAESELARLGQLVVGMEARLGRVAGKIGSGAFGTVWRLQRSEGGDLAYKVYHPSDLGNLEKKSRFIRGFRAMKQLEHPHIVKVHELTECPVGFSMDFIHGANARDYAAADIEPIEVIQQLQIVAETLQHAHSRGVVHRDVKPENLVMSWHSDQMGYRPNLTDFDLAWFSTATQFTREALGSLIYAAPEQLSKPGAKSAHAVTTDIYSFGQLLFFLLCSRDPVPQVSDNERALRSQLSNRLSARPSEDLVVLYRECTHVDPSRRIQDLRTIIERLHHVSRAIERTQDDATLESLDFCREVVFSMVGAMPERKLSDLSFNSTSGRTLVEVSLKDRIDDQLRLTLRLQVQFGLGLLHGTENARARRILNQRMDAAISSFRNATRHPGNQSPFETFVELDRVPSNPSGVLLVREVLSRVLDCIESG